MRLTLRDFPRHPHRGLLPDEGAVLSAARDASPAVKLTKVTKSFGTKTVLSGLDLTVTRGESLVLVGQPGIGKSVLLKHVVGLQKPDSGTVEIDGEDLGKGAAKDRDRPRREVGTSFQGRQ